MQSCIVIYAKSLSYRTEKGSTCRVSNVRFPELKKARRKSSKGVADHRGSLLHIFMYHLDPHCRCQLVSAVLTPKDASNIAKQCSGNANTFPIITIEYTPILIMLSHR